MIKITNFLYYDDKKIKNSPLFSEVLNCDSLSFKFLYAINSLLNVKFKFFKDFFIAEENDSPKALIGIKILAGEEIRAVITNFILAENSLNIAERLINSIVQKYSAKGVSTFYIHIDNYDDELKNLFLSKANFRVLTSEVFFDIKREYEGYNSHSYIKKICDKNAVACLDLYNYLLEPNFKFYFKKNIAEFKQSLLFKGAQEKFSYVIQNPKTDEIYAYFTLNNISKDSWILEPIITLRYASYILDVIEFANSLLAKKYQNYSLNLLLGKYFISSADIISVLQNSNFEIIKENLILSKDYLKRIKDTAEVGNSRIIFNDINPAY